MVRMLMDRIAEAGLVSIIRGIDGEKITQVADALLQGGVQILEITFDTPGAAGMIEMLKKAYGGQITLGAGTVLDTETARTAILSGADFILAPSLDTGVIELCNRYGKLAVPGVLTPTEMVRAMEAGAQIVKLFPARTFGPQYIKDIKGPLKQVEIMAVGGITADNAGEYIKNGALALGIGSELVNGKLAAAGSFAEITKRALLFREAVSNARKG